MYGQISTLAFVGIEARPVEVQVRITPGLTAFAIVGLPDKAVAESRERVRSALHAVGLGLPYKHLTVNLAPADLPKEGSHFDLHIVLALMVALEAIAPDAVAGYAAVGELALDGSIRGIPGALPAAIGANAMGKGLICPAAVGPEAAWAGEDLDILAPPHLLALVNHFKGLQTLSCPKPNLDSPSESLADLKDVRGQESAKRALEVAAAGGHNLLMIGPPGSGKSMLAARLPSILPPLAPEEMLEVSMVHSLAGELMGGRLAAARPFRAPHHSASMPSLVGGGSRPKPGEVSLAHLGVLFLDELPEFHGIMAQTHHKWLSLNFDLSTAYLGGAVEIAEPGRIYFIFPWPIAGLTHDCAGKRDLSTKVFPRSQIDAVDFDGLDDQVRHLHYFGGSHRCSFARSAIVAMPPS